MKFAPESLEMRRLLAVVSEHITSDTRWTVEESPYEVTRDIDVERGATLRIDAGVEVRFRPRTGIDVSDEWSPTESRTPEYASFPYPDATAGTG